MQSCPDLSISDAHKLDKTEIMKNGRLHFETSEHNMVHQNKISNLFRMKANFHGNHYMYIAFESFFCCDLLRSNMKSKNSHRRVFNSIAQNQVLYVPHIKQ